MATADNGRSPYESGGVGEKFRKRPFRSEINEEPQNVSQEAGQNNATGVSEPSTQQGGNFASISITIGKSELEQMLKQMTFTRSETQHLIALLHSRTIEESPTPLSIKRHKHASCLPKTRMASTMENLPDEVLVNIFIRLFAKQLAQMRSVSKSWNALLSHSSFVKSHLDRSLHYNNQTLLVFNNEQDFKIFTAHTRESPHLQLTDFSNLPVNPRPEHKCDIKVIGCVNGLICFSYGDLVLQIWNPSLSAMLTLPPFSMPYVPITTHVYYYYYRFGFDPKAEDYKVVRLTCRTKLGTNVAVRWLQVEIYSMRRGSWELITERFPSRITSIRDDDGVCVDGHDGHLHWLCGVGENDDLQTIVAFDLGSETFREMPLPNSMLDHKYRREVYLGVLGRKVCVMSLVELAESASFEVWVMEEYGAAESWVKRHVFSQFYDDTFPYGFTSYNELLLELGSRLVLYDPIENKEKYIKGPSGKHYFAQKIVKYVDSLVWIAPVKHQMMHDARQGLGYNKNDNYCVTL